MDSFADTSKIDSIGVIMAVYNEDRTLRQAIIGIEKVLSKYLKAELIIVESNSADSSRVILRDIKEKWNSKVQLKIIYQELALGKGNALREGLKHLNAEVIAIYDADLEYNPLDLMKLTSLLEEGNTSFVLGSRLLNSGQMREFKGDRLRSKMYNLGHIVFTSWFNFLFATNLKDPFTMWKVFRKDVLNQMSLTADRFDFDWELLGKAARLGCNIQEVPCSYSSRGFAEGKKVRTFRDPIAWISHSMKYRFTRLKGKDF